MSSGTTVISSSPSVGTFLGERTDKPQVSPGSCLWVSFCPKTSPERLAEDTQGLSHLCCFLKMWKEQQHYFKLLARWLSSSAYVYWGTQLASRGNLLWPHVSAILSFGRLAKANGHVWRLGQIQSIAFPLSSFFITTNQYNGSQWLVTVEAAPPVNQMISLSFPLEQDPKTLVLLQ